MAEQNDERNREDLSEEPSAHRIEELRKKGQVAQSRELTAAITFAFVMFALYWLGPQAGAKIGNFFGKWREVSHIRSIDFTNIPEFLKWLHAATDLFWSLVLPVFFIAFAISLVGSFFQVGSVFSFEPLMPQWERVNPVSGLKRFFSLKKIYDSLRWILKSIVLVGVAVFLLKTDLFSWTVTLLMDPHDLFRFFGKASMFYGFSFLVVLLVFALLDFWIQRWDYGKSIRVTKQEAKEELKEQEGDPLTRSRIRSIQREMVRKRMLEDVKKATVIVTNPTHIAVALSYDRSKTPAPKVVAKGVDFLAQKIKKVAKEHQIPVVENPPLARVLYRTVKVGKEIPRALYQTVAEVLAFVYRLKKKTFFS